MREIRNTLYEHFFPKVCAKIKMQIKIIIPARNMDLAVT